MASQADAGQKEAARCQVATAVLCSLATIVVFLRLLSRKISDAKLWWDDAFIIIAILFAWAAAGALFWGVSADVGDSDKVLGFQTERTLGRIALLEQNGYYCCIAFVKFSILAFYRRLFPVNVLRIITFVLIGIITSWWIAVTLVSILNCTPIDYNWDRTQPDGHCLDARIFAVTNSIPTIVTDLFILLLPLPVIWNLQLQPSRKIALSMIFSLGIFVTVSSAIRLVALANNHNLTPTFFWTNVEPDVAIICACLPTMMPLLRLIRQKLAFEATLLRTYSNPFPVPKSQGSRGKNSKPRSILTNNRDGFINLADGMELSTATSRAWKSSLPVDEATSLAEEGFAMGKVHVRNDADVSHDQI